MDRALLHGLPLEFGSLITTIDAWSESSKIFAQDIVNRKRLQNGQCCTMHEANW